MKKAFPHRSANNFYSAAIVLSILLIFQCKCFSSLDGHEIVSTPYVVQDCHHNTTFIVTRSNGAIQCEDLTDAQSWRIEVGINETIRINLVHFNAVPCPSQSQCEAKPSQCDAISIYEIHLNSKDPAGFTRTLRSRTCSDPHEELSINTTTNIAIIRYQPGTGSFPPGSNQNRKFLIGFDGIEKVEDLAITTPFAQYFTPSKTNGDVKSIGIGIAIGAGIVVLIGIGIAFYCHYRRKKARSKFRSRPSDFRGIRGDEADGLSPATDHMPLPIPITISRTPSRTPSRTADQQPMKQEDVLATLQLAATSGGDFKLKPPNGSTFQQADDDVITNDCVFDLPYGHIELKMEQLRFSQEPIGIGSYGVVYKASFIPTYCETPTSINERHLTRRLVAVKKMRMPTEIYRRALEAELKLLTHIGRHPYILELVGAITEPDEDFSIVGAFCELGTLQQFIGNFHSIEQVNSVSQCRPPVINLGDLLLIAEQIANGMHYVHYRKCAHRDLAARNILLTAKRIPKITDFGLGRTLNPTAFFTTKQDGEFPWKWCALEVLQGELFELKSDVWSFGVLMWEIFSLGRKPYAEVLRCNSDFIDSLKSGVRLPRPRLTPKEVYNLMLQCWRMIPDERPPFSELERMLLGYRTS